MWSIGLRADDPEASSPRRWIGKKLLEKAYSAVRDAIRASEAGLANPASSHQICTPTSSDGINYVSPAPLCPMVLARTCPDSSSEFSTSFSDVPAENSPDVLAVAPGLDPSLALSEHASLSRRRYHYARQRLFHHEDRGSQRFTAELTPSRVFAARHSSTLVPHRPSSCATYWISCSRSGSNPSRANGNAPLDPVVVLANLPLWKLRRASA